VLIATASSTAHAKSFIGVLSCHLVVLSETERAVELARGSLGVGRGIRRVEKRRAERVDRLVYHRVSEERLARRTQENGAPAPVVTSAGALVDGLHSMGFKRISVVCPYMKPLTKMVVDYIESEGIEVKDYVALEIPDNLQVAAQDPTELI
jgi:hypothetical protein